MNSKALTLAHLGIEIIAILPVEMVAEPRTLNFIVKITCSVLLVTFGGEGGKPKSDQK